MMRKKWSEELLPQGKTLMNPLFDEFLPRITIKLIEVQFRFCFERSRFCFFLDFCLNSTFKLFRSNRFFQAVHEMELQIFQNRNSHARFIYPSRDCIEVLHAFVSCLKIFTSFYMMHAKFYMHENLTVVGNFYKFFYAVYKIWMQQIYFNFYEFFHAACKICYAHFRKLHAIKILSAW